MIFEESWLKVTLYKNSPYTRTPSFGLRRQLPILHPEWRQTEKRSVGSRLSLCLSNIDVISSTFAFKVDKLEKMTHENSEFGNFECKRRKFGDTEAHYRRLSFIFYLQNNTWPQGCQLGFWILSCRPWPCSHFP